jgi:predicted phage terminase large subunit-like protein
VAPTFSDARDTDMEGDSGLLRALRLTRSYRGWNRSMGELFLPGGGRVFCDGADDGAYRIQGKNLSGLWADEVGLWRRWREAWDESIAFAVRIEPAKIIATGTPKRGHGLVRRLIDDPAVAQTLLRTMDNAGNLSAAALADLLDRYGGTTLGAQELEGAILNDADGALWKREQIRYGEAPLRGGPGGLVPDYARIVIGVDPAVTAGEDADETGIIVAAKGADGRGYILDDLSGRLDHNEWRRRVIAAYDEYRADLVVAEVNNGGDLVAANLRSGNWRGAYRAVHASRGKRTRAEPVAGLYEQGRVSHLRAFPELEDQLCNFTPETLTSPDRLDALVWAMTELLITTPTLTSASEVGLVNV